MIFEVCIIFFMLFSKNRCRQLCLYKLRYTFYIALHIILYKRPTRPTEPTQSTIYVINNGDNTLSVIDGTTNTLIATIPVGSIHALIELSKKLQIKTAIAFHKFEKL